MQSRALLQHVVRTLAASGLYLAAQVVASILIARMLGVEGRGHVAAAVLIPMLVGYAGELGLPVATGFLTGTRPEGRRLILATSQTLALALAMVLLLLAAALIVLMPLEAEARLAAFVFLPFIPLNVFQRVYLAVLQADLRLTAFNAIRVAGSAIYLGIIGALYVSGSASIEAVILAQLAGNAIWFALPLAFVRPLPGFGFDRGTARALLSYGIRAHVGSMSAIDTLRIDQLLVALLLTTQDLGLYAAAGAFITANRMIGLSVGMVAFPAAVGARDSLTSRASQLPLLLLATVAASVPLAAVEMRWGADLLRTILGADFEAAARPLVILAAASVFMNVRQVLSDWLRGSGRAGVATAGELVALVILAASAYVLRDGGVAGVAWAVLFAAASSSAVVAGLLLVTSGSMPFRWRGAGRPRLVLPSLALLLFAASGVVSPLMLAAGTDILWPVGLSLLFLMPVVWRVSRGAFDIFDPILWVALAFLAMFVVRPAWRMWADDFTYNGYDVREGLFSAMTVAAVGYCAILVGYGLWIGAAIGRALPSPPAALHASTILPYCLGLSLIGVLLFSLFVYSSGGLAFLSTYISSRSVEQSAAFRDSSAYLYYAPYLAIPALLLLIRCAPRKTRMIYWLLAIAPASLALLNSFGRGNRAWLFPLLGSIFILYYLSQQRRPRLLTIASSLILVFVLFSAMRESRFVEQNESLTGQLAAFARQPHEAVFSLIESGDMGMVDALAIEMTAVPEEVPFRPGVVVTSALSRPIPSQLWPDKPTPPDGQLNRLLWPDRYEATSYLPTFSALGELYADSGLVGVVLGMTGFGVILRVVRQYWQHNTGNPIAQILFALTLPLLIVYLRGNAGDTLGRTLFLVVPILFVPLFARVREDHGHIEQRSIPGVSLPAIR